MTTPINNESERTRLSMFPLIAGCIISFAVAWMIQEHDKEKRLRAVRNNYFDMGAGLIGVVAYQIPENEWVKPEPWELMTKLARSNYTHHFHGTID